MFVKRQVEDLGAVGFQEVKCEDLMWVKFTDQNSRAGNILECFLVSFQMAGNFKSAYKKTDQAHLWKDLIS